MLTKHTPLETVREAITLLMSLVGDPKVKDFIPVVAQNDGDMEQFVGKVGDLLSLTKRIAEVTAEVNERRIEQRKLDVARLRRLSETEPSTN
jgi:hypothetical protein